MCGILRFVRVGIGGLSGFRLRWVDVGCCLFSLVLWWLGVVVDCWGVTMLGECVMVYLWLISVVGVFLVWAWICVGCVVIIRVTVFI